LAQEDGLDQQFEVAGKSAPIEKSVINMIRLLLMSMIDPSQ